VVPDEELDRLYDQADIFAMTSIDHRHSVEGFGLVYLEAAAHSLPVVAHAVGGVAEAVVDGVTGLLVPPADRPALSAAFARLIADPALRGRLGAAGSEARYLQTSEALEGLHVRDLMTRDPVTASADETLGAFTGSLAGRAHSTYPVVSGGDVVGLLPFRAITRYPRSDWEGRLVRDSMLKSDQVPMLDSEASAEGALSELAGGEIHRGLVVHDGGLVGLISISDIARVLNQRTAFRR